MSVLARTFPTKPLAIKLLTNLTDLLTIFTVRRIERQPYTQL